MTSTPLLARKRALGQEGFSATELIVVVAVIGILMAGSVPFLLSTWRTSALRAGAEELATVLGQARQMAIKDNTSICVTTSAAGTRFWRGPCGNPPSLWTGPGTDGAGYIRLANNMTVALPAPTVIFTYIGTANAVPLPYRVISANGGPTLSVSVAPSGRISIGP